MKAIDVHKSYTSGKRLHAVCGNTFAVSKGKVMGLLGPNGAGKSTTFSIMAMQERRSEGSAQVLGQSLNEIDLKGQGKYLSMCPQYNSIWEQFTVIENLMFIGRIKGLPRALR